MTRALLLACLVSVSPIAFAQNYIPQYASGVTGFTGTAPSNVFQDGYNNIGIGATTLNAALHVVGATGAPNVIQSSYPVGTGSPPNYYIGVQAPSGDGSPPNPDFMVNGTGQVGIGRAAYTGVDLLVQDHLYAPTGDFGKFFMAAIDDNGHFLMSGSNVGATGASSGMLLVYGNSSIDGGVTGASGYNHPPLAILDNSSTPLNPMLMVSGVGTVSIGTMNYDPSNSNSGPIGQLDIMQNNIYTDYLMRVGNYNNTETNLFSIDNNGYVGIGQLNSAGGGEFGKSNLLQVSDVNDLGLTTILEVDHSGISESGPSNYFVANSDAAYPFPGHIDFMINGVGQVGIGTAAVGSLTDLLIQDHGYPGVSNILNTNNAMAAVDDGNNLLAVLANVGTSTNPSAALVIGTNSVNPYPTDPIGANPALTNPPPTFAVTGQGYTMIGTSTAVAQLDVVHNNTVMDYMLHIGNDALDLFAVHNAGYVGIGQLNSGASLVEVSDVGGTYGSTIPLLEVDNGTPATPFFEVWGSSTGVNAGIGINPITEGIGSTLAMQGVGGTTLDIFAGTGGGTGWDPQMRFINKTGTVIRNIIADSHSDSMLVIIPGYDASDGAKNVVNIQGKLIIGAPTDIYTPSAGGDLTNTYALIVRTGILTEMAKVAVRTTADWSDYVFDKGYQLPTFNQLENYITTNKHLPDVPSAQQVVNSGGVDVAKMDAKLLQKIEELNLYVIQLEKENKKQDEQIEKLLKKVKMN